MFEEKLKLKIEKGGNNSLLQEHKEEIQVIFHISIDLLTSSILNDNSISRFYFDSKIKEIYIQLFKDRPRGKESTEV